MGTIYKSNLNDLIKHVDDALKHNMRIACEFAAGYCKRLISRPNARGHNPSRPGEPPKRVLGTLRSSIGYHVNLDRTGVHGYLGVARGPAYPYAWMLEMGWSGMVARRSKYGKRSVYHYSLSRRPYLRPTVTDNRAKLGRIVATGK